MDSLVFQIGTLSVEELLDLTQRLKKEPAKEPPFEPVGVPTGPTPKPDVPKEDGAIAVPPKRGEDQ